MCSSLSFISSTTKPSGHRHGTQTNAARNKPAPSVYYNKPITDAAWKKPTAVQRIHDEGTALRPVTFFDFRGRRHDPDIVIVASRYPKNPGKTNQISFDSPVKISKETLDQSNFVSTQISDTTLIT